MENILEKNISNGFLNQSNINYIIEKIFIGKIPNILKIIGNNIEESRNISNYLYHKNQIEIIINKLINLNTTKNFVLSRIIISRINKINFDVYLSNNNNELKFYFAGEDLVKYHMFLPKFYNKHNKIIKPITGSHNSKWYPFELKYFIMNIAINLRLFEILLRKIKITSDYNQLKIGILGCEVSFKIPESYKFDKIICNDDEIKSNYNPIKIKDGLFVFGKNGVNIKNSQKIINFLRLKYSKFNDSLYPTHINNYLLDDFIKSPYNFALTIWNQHTRILVKDNLIESSIKVIDPWMKKLPFEIKNKLILNNPSIQIDLLNRTCVDQGAEGSCTLCAISRLLFLIDNYISREKDSLDLLCNIKIPDFYAYFASLMFRKILFTT